MAAAALFAGGIVVLGLGAFVWARAFAEIQRARVLRQSADANDITLEASQEAIDELAVRRDERLERDPHEAPTDEELYRQVLAERGDPGEDYDMTTARNEGVKEDYGIAPDQMYIPEEAV